ncbi:Cytosolic Phospholipase A2 Beta, partial [Manis pentadactyla]
MQGLGLVFPAISDSFQDYSEARVISILMVEFQAKGLSSLPYGSSCETFKLLVSVQ